MAAPADKTVRNMGRGGGSDQDAELPAEFNKLVAAFRTLCTKLDNDAGVTDTNYFALCADSAASGPAKVVPSSG
jgi:hypothetical protein